MPDPIVGLFADDPDMVDRVLEVAMKDREERNARVPDLLIEVEQEDDGRWIAGARAVPGALAYGATPEEAVLRATEIAQSARATVLAPDDV